MTQISEPIVFSEKAYATKYRGSIDQSNSPHYFNSLEELFDYVKEGEEVAVYEMVGMFRARRRVDLEKEE
jgi:hypothetical protein